MGTRRNRFSALALCLGLVAALAACQMDYSGSVMGTSRELHMKYTAFNTTEAQALDLEAGDEIAVSVVSQEGAVSLAIQKEGAQPIYQGEDLTTQDFTVAVEEAGWYTVTVTGSGAVGSVDPQRARVDGVGGRGPDAGKR